MKIKEKVIRDFIKIDPRALLEGAIDAFEKETNEFLYAGDERRILINVSVALATQIAYRDNFLFNQNFTQYAIEEYLDNIGQDRGVDRLQPQKAICTLEYTLVQPFDQIQIIPKGTRATADGVLFYETTEEVVFLKGEVKKSVVAQATQYGVAHNGFKPGQINVQVDIKPYISNVANIDIPQNGADLEDDLSYSERILLHPATYSTAGPELAYVYHTKTADIAIGSVFVTSPNPGEVLVVFLLKDGSIPEVLLIEKVYTALNQRTVRPLTDKVIVSAGRHYMYDIDFSYTIASEDSNRSHQIKESIQEAIQKYIEWQKEELGRFINPDRLEKHLLNAGAYTVTMQSPEFFKIGYDEIAIAENINIVYEGIL